MSVKIKKDLAALIAELKKDHGSNFRIVVQGLTLQLDYKRGGWETRQVQLARFKITGSSNPKSAYGSAMHRRDQHAELLRRWLKELEEENVE